MAPCSHTPSDNATVFPLSSLFQALFGSLSQRWWNKGFFPPSKSKSLAVIVDGHDLSWGVNPVFGHRYLMALVMGSLLSLRRSYPAFRGMFECPLQFLSWLTYCTVGGRSFWSLLECRNHLERAARCTSCSETGRALPASKGWRITGGFSKNQAPLFLLCTGVDVQCRRL